MDLGFARRSTDKPSSDLGSLLARVSSEQVLSPTASLMALATREEVGAFSNNSVLSAFVTKRPQRPFGGSASFNPEVAVSLIQKRQPL